MTNYSNLFKEIILSLEIGQFRTVKIGDNIETAKTKEEGNEMHSGNIYMPYIQYFVRFNNNSHEFKLMYLYDNNTIDHIQFSIEYREHSPLSVSLEDLNLITNDFLTFFNENYGEVVEKGKQGLGNKGRESFQVWHFKNEQITLVNHFKPKEKTPSYLQITFAKLV